MPTIINAANLARLREGLNTRFQRGLQATPSLDVTRIATVVASSTAIENYPMTVFLDTIRKWVVCSNDVTSCHITNF